MRHLTQGIFSRSLAIIRNIFSYLAYQFLDIYYFGYRMIIKDHWDNLCSILIYEVVSFFLSGSKISIHWHENLNFKDINIKYVLLFPILNTKSKIEYIASNHKKNLQKSYSVFYCEDLALKESLTLELRQHYALKDVIDYTVPLLYFLCFVVMLAPFGTMLMQAFLFGNQMFNSQMLTVILKSYIYLLLIFSIFTIIGLYIKVDKIMERRSAFKYATRVTLASIIVFPIFIMLYAIQLLYYFVMLMNKVVYYLVSIRRRLTKDSNVLYLDKLFAIKDNKNLFNMIDPVDYVAMSLITDYVVAIFFSKMASIIWSHDHSSKEIQYLIKKLKIKQSNLELKMDSTIEGFQRIWHYGIVLLVLKLYNFTVSALTNRLSLAEDVVDLVEIHKKPISIFALSVLKRNSRYIFLFVLSMPMLILTRNILRIFFSCNNIYSIYVSDLKLNEDLYKKMMEKYYNCSIEEGCKRFSHVYLPDLGISGNLHK